MVDGDSVLALFSLQSCLNINLSLFHPITNNKENKGCRLLELGQVESETEAV